MCILKIILLVKIHSAKLPLCLEQWGRFEKQNVLHRTGAI